MNRRAASGIDGEMMKELDRRVEEVVERLKTGSYKAPAIRRVEIPKGFGKTRLLGITMVEDRLVQRAVARILSSIYEQDFLDLSYGYRPGRSTHHALQSLRSQIVTKKVRHVYEADIRGYFTKINHQWLRRMLAERIVDRTILRLINKWLKAGVMVKGVSVRQESGVPQGGPVSCVLANIYLHYVLDLWFEKKFKKWCQGEEYLTRFVDDFVCCFEYKRDAERLDRNLVHRVKKFGLELAPEKTRILQDSLPDITVFHDYGMNLRLPRPMEVIQTGWHPSQKSMYLFWMTGDWWRRMKNKEEIYWKYLKTDIKNEQPSLPANWLLLYGMNTLVMQHLQMLSLIDSFITRSE